MKKRAQIKIQHSPPNEIARDLGVKFAGDMSDLILRSLRVMIAGEIEGMDAIEIIMSCLAGSLSSLAKTAHGDPEVAVSYIDSAITCDKEARARR